MKINDIFPFKTAPFFTNPFLFMGKPTLFFWKFWKLTPPWKMEESNHEVLIFSFRLSLSVVKFNVKPTITEYRHKNCAAQFCIFRTKMKKNGRAVILNLLKYKWEPDLCIISPILFQCKWFKYGTIHNVSTLKCGIYTHFLPLKCFKTIEWYKSNKCTFSSWPSFH